MPWLQKQLLVNGIAAHTPEMPNSWKPDYPTWRKEFERYDITPNTILVGHSNGAGFLIRWLSEHRDIHVNKVVLVAPSLDPDRSYTTDFFDFGIDANLENRTTKLVIFNSDNDYDFIQRSIAIIRQNISNVAYREFRGYGHFCLGNMGTEKFPELLAELLN